MLKYLYQLLILIVLFFKINCLTTGDVYGIPYAIPVLVTILILIIISSLIVLVFLSLKKSDINNINFGRADELNGDVNSTTGVIFTELIDVDTKNKLFYSQKENNIQQQQPQQLQQQPQQQYQQQPQQQQLQQQLQQQPQQQVQQQNNADSSTDRTLARPSSSILSNSSTNPSINNRIILRAKRLLSRKSSSDSKTKNEDKNDKNEKNDKNDDNNEISDLHEMLERNTMNDDYSQRQQIKPKKRSDFRRPQPVSAETIVHATQKSGNSTTSVDMDDVCDNNVSFLSQEHVIDSKRTIAGRLPRSDVTQSGSK